MLSHKRLVVLAWILLAGLGFAILPTTNRHLASGFTAPGREAYVVNQTMLKEYGAVGDVSPIVAVVHLPSGVKATTPSVRTKLGNVFATLQRAEPSARVVSFASTGSSAFVSAHSARSPC